MLGDWLQADDAASSRPALVTTSVTVSWSDFRKGIQARAKQFDSIGDKRVGLLLAPNAESVTLLFSLANAGIHVFLIAADTSDALLTEWSTDFGIACVFQSDGSRVDYEHTPQTGTHGAITILTSGTTGKPKAVQHTFESLVRPVRRVPSDSPHAHPRWLLTYRPHLYAGLQVIMQCLLNYGALVMAAGDSADDVAILACAAKAEFASATPSYWRWLLTLASAEALTRIPLQQITLGGEAVDQPTLNALRNRFPDTRLVHIYATTELGRCFSVTDGNAGFPSRFLDQVSADGVEMRIEAETENEPGGDSCGELVVRSANAMSGYDQNAAAETVSPQSDWFHTGDLVNTIGDRVFFVGRKTEMINVGGNKVYPVEVENVIRSVAGVADTRVYGEASSIVGQLVKCDLVVESGFEPEAVEQAVRAASLEKLTSYQRPRFISIVEAIPRTAAGKTDRS